MSFDLICQNCGAPTGPSVGICPYCKTVMSPKGTGTPVNTAVSAIQKAFNEGRLENAVSFASLAESKNAEAMKDPSFLILFARILIETEAPTTKVASILNQALLIDPSNVDAADYLELLEARLCFTTEMNDPGEMRIRKLLERRKDLDLGYFILGAHLFWIQHETQQSVRLLEECVKLRPNFLRAWGCLGSIYQKLGSKPQSIRAFQNCLRLESQPQMRQFFQEQLKHLGA